jgi:hypothetical protein
MSCTSAELIESAKCFLCLSEKQLLAIIANLSCSIAGQDTQKVYRASIVPAPTPDVTVLENSVGPIVWTYNQPLGRIIGTLAGAFPTGKTFVLSTMGVNDSGQGTIYNTYVSGENIVFMEFTNGQEFQDWNFTPVAGEPERVWVEIRVYP